MNMAELCELAGLPVADAGDRRGGDGTDAYAEAMPVGIEQEANEEQDILVEEDDEEVEEGDADNEAEDSGEEDVVDEEPVRAREVLFNEATNLFKFKAQSSAEGEVITRGELLGPPHRLYSWFLTACSRRPNIWHSVDDVIDPDGKLTGPLLG